MVNYFSAIKNLVILRQRQFWDKKRLNSYQNKRLREIITYAYENSHFYHETFKRAGIRPEDIQTTEDISKLPILRKTEIVKKSEDVVSNKFDLAQLKVCRTSGSTGRPLHIYITQAENEFRKARHIRAQMALGQKPWDKWVTITSPLHFAETTKLQKVLHLFSITPVSVFDDVSAQIAKITSANPDVLDGYSNSIFLLAKEMKKRGLDPFRPKFLVGGSELMDQSCRKFVEDFFSGPFYDQYASVEFERIAWQCREKRGYHIDYDTVIMEFVDKNGEEVGPGEQGEIVCTSLFNYAMPFIRYGLEDFGIRSDETECGCGRSFPLMKLIEGRKTSFLSLPDGRVFAPIAFMLAVWTFKYYGDIDLFRVVQKRRDLIAFLLKVANRSVDTSRIEIELLEHLKKVLNLPTDDVRVEVDFVDDIPLDKNGKFSIVVSELPRTS